MHLTLVRVAVLLVCCVILSPAGAADLPELVPDNTLLYVAWPGLDAFSTAAGQTEMAKLMAEPQMQKFREHWSKKVWPAIQDKIRQALQKEESSELYEPIMSLLSASWKYPLALTFQNVEFTPAGPQIDAALVIQAGPDAAKLADGMDRILAFAVKSEKHVKLADVEIAGIRIKEFVPPEFPVPFRYGVVNDVFVFGLGERIWQHLAVAGSKSLASNKRFVDAMKFTGGSTKVPVVFADLHGIITLVEKFQPLFANQQIPILGEPGGVAHVAASLGLEDVRSLASVVVPEGAGFKTVSFLHAPSLGQAATTQPANRPITDAELKVIPRDVSWAMVTRFDLLAAYKGIFQTLQQIAPSAGAVAVPATQTAELMVGFRIDRDLLGAFGDTWTLYDSPASGGIIITGITLIADAKDDSRLDTSMERLAFVIGKFLGKGNSLTVQREDYRGQKVCYVQATGVPLPVAPAWAHCKGKVVAALFPQMVRVAVDQLLDGGESLLDNPDFQNLRKFLPANPSSISYSDSPRGLRILYAILLPLTDAGIGYVRGEGIPFDFGMLPAWPVFARHLFGDVSANVTTKDGLLCVSYGALPGGLGTMAVAAASVPVATAILLPSLARARELSKRTVSAANLKAIGTAVLIYAENHKGQSPPDLETLVKEELITPQTLVSPCDRSGGQNSYIYLRPKDRAAESGSVPPSQVARMVVAYENPANFGDEGTNVLFLDGRVQWMSAAAFDELLQATRKRLETKPAE